MNRIRIGSEGDGGYVMMNKDLDKVEVLYSYGVGNNSDFEHMFSENYGAIARIYDHTVDKTSIEGELFDFKKEGIWHKKTENHNTLENHIKQNNDGNKKMILKIDVEGAEWDILRHIPDAVLGLFDQFSIEVHFLHSTGLHSTGPYYRGNKLSELEITKKTDVIKKIKKSYYLYHVHANNNSPLYYINGFKIPNCMELTFINKKQNELAKKSNVIFPTKFDRPCDPNRKDVDLHFWPFYPGIIRHISEIISNLRWKSCLEIIRLIFKQIETRLKSFLIRVKLRRPTSHS